MSDEADPENERIPLPQIDEVVRSQAGLRIFQFCELADQNCEVIIQHQGQEYRLKCTSRGKLLLVK
jgi:hemin uptake protein HemP